MSFKTLTPTNDVLVMQQFVFLTGQSYEQLTKMNIVLGLLKFNSYNYAIYQKWLHFMSKSVCIHV